MFSNVHYSLQKAKPLGLLPLAKGAPSSPLRTLGVTVTAPHGGWGTPRPAARSRLAGQPRASLLVCGALMPVTGQGACAGVRPGVREPGLAPLPAICPQPRFDLADPVSYGSAGSPRRRCGLLRLRLWNAGFPQPPPLKGALSPGASPWDGDELSGHTGSPVPRCRALGTPTSQTPSGWSSLRPPYWDRKQINGLF